MPLTVLPCLPQSIAEDTRLEETSPSPECSLAAVYARFSFRRDGRSVIFLPVQNALSPESFSKCFLTSINTPFHPNTIHRKVSSVPLIFFIYYLTALKASFYTMRGSGQNVPANSVLNGNAICRVPLVGLDHCCLPA